MSERQILFRIFGGWESKTSQKRSKLECFKGSKNQMTKMYKHILGSETKPPIF